MIGRQPIANYHSLVARSKQS